MAFCGSGANFSAPVAGDPVVADDGDDLVDTITTYKVVRVPCTRNVTKQYTVKVPRVVTEKIPKVVNWVEQKPVTTKVAKTIYKNETRYRNEIQNYTVPVREKYTTLVDVVKQVPKTVYVNVTEKVPKENWRIRSEPRTRNIRIPYNVKIPEVIYNDVTTMVNVPRTRTDWIDRHKTVYDSQVRSTIVPQHTTVTKRIPVVNVVAKPPKPCPPGTTDCASGDCGPEITGALSEFNAMDTNRDGKLSPEEYINARTGGALISGGGAIASGGGSFTNGNVVVPGGYAYQGGYAAGGGYAYPASGGYSYSAYPGGYTTRGAGGGVVGQASGLASGAIGLASGAASGAYNTASGVASGAYDMTSAAAGRATGLASGVASGATGMASGAVDRASGAVSGVTSGLKSGFSALTGSKK